MKSKYIQQAENFSTSATTAIQPSKLISDIKAGNIEKYFLDEDRNLERIVKIPNSILKHITEDKYLITTLLGICLIQNMDRTATFSINSLIKTCGMTPNRGAGRNIESVRNTLANLVYLQYFEFSNSQLNLLFNKDFIEKHGDYRRQAIEGLQTFTQITIVPHTNYKEISQSNFTLFSLNTFKKLIDLSKTSKHNLIDFVNVYFFLKYQYDLKNNYFEKEEDILSLKEKKETVKVKGISLSYAGLEDKMSYNKKTIILLLQELEKAGMINIYRQSSKANIFVVCESKQFYINKNKENK